MEHASAVHLALREAVQVLEEQNVKTVTTYRTEKRLLSSQHDIITGLQGWPVADHFMNREGDLFALALMSNSRSLDVTTAARLADLPYLRKASLKLDPEGRYAYSGGAQRIDLSALDPVCPYSRYLDHTIQPSEHQTPRGSKSLILGLPQGPLLGYIKTSRDLDSNWLTRPLLDAISKSVLTLVASGR